MTHEGAEFCRAFGSVLLRRSRRGGFSMRFRSEGVLALRRGGGAVSYAIDIGWSARQRQPSERR